MIASRCSVGEAVEAAAHLLALQPRADLVGDLVVGHVHRRRGDLLHPVRRGLLGPHAVHGAAVRDGEHPREPAAALRGRTGSRCARPRRAPPAPSPRPAPGPAARGGPARTPAARAGRRAGRRPSRHRGRRRAAGRRSRSRSGRRTAGAASSRRGPRSGSVMSPAFRDVRRGAEGVRRCVVSGWARSGPPTDRRSSESPVCLRCARTQRRGRPIPAAYSTASTDPAGAATHSHQG